MTYLQLWAAILVGSFIWKGYKQELQINKPARLVDSCWYVQIPISTTSWHSPAAAPLTKTNRARTNKQNVAEVFNRLVWPIIGELVKLSAISCFYYRSTFSCTGVIRLCVAATRHSGESWGDIMLANLIFVAAVLEQPGEFRCKAVVDWMTWASTSLLARWTWLTQRAAKRRSARRRSTSSNWDRAWCYGPTQTSIWAQSIK